MHNCRVKEIYIIDNNYIIYEKKQEKEYSCRKDIFKNYSRFIKILSRIIFARCANHSV